MAYCILKSDFSLKGSFSEKQFKRLLTHSITPGFVAFGVSFRAMMTL